MQERWMADQAILYRLMRLHPEWTQKEVAAWIGRSVGWVKKWFFRRFAAAERGYTTRVFEEDGRCTGGE